MRKRTGLAKHHPLKMDVAHVDRVDWLLRNLWETPDKHGAWRMVQEISEEEHRARHKEQHYFSKRKTR